MMRGIDILTTNISKLVCANIKEPNQIYNPSKEELEGIKNSGEIKAISYMYEVGLQKYEIEDSFGVLLKHLATELKSNATNEIKAYLFVSDAVWQPNTKIVSYYGLWKRKLFSDEFLEGKLLSKEIVIESEQGLRYSGIVEVDFFNMTDAISLALNNAGIFLYVSSNSFQEESENVTKYYESCYPKDEAYEIDLPNILGFAEEISQNGNLIVRPTKDDPSPVISLDIFSFFKSEIFERLFSAGS